MPGANGITALNSFVHRTAVRRPDAVVGSISAIDPLVYRTSIRNTIPGRCGYVGGIGRGGSVIFVNKAAESRLLRQIGETGVIGSVQALPRPAMQP